VDGYAVHAVIVIGCYHERPFVLVPDDRAANHHRVDGKTRPPYVASGNGGNATVYFGPQFRTG
jgi:hypothetical protein